MDTRFRLTIVLSALLLAACGGGGGSSSPSSSAAVGGASIGGTVPGTLIEAFGDNGSYYAVNSNDNATNRHPFRLDLPARVGFHLVMVTGEGTPDEVITPIGFRDSTGRVNTRLMLNHGSEIDLGYVPLPMGRNAAAADDRDSNGVLDNPMILDDVGANNPLSQSDADDDGVDDWADPDHGGYQYDNSTSDPQDDDDDGIPNSYDDDYHSRSDDSDSDGLPDSVDANPYNERDHANDDLDEDCDHDGYNDDDSNRDGYHDDDLDHDGEHDNGADDHSNDNNGSCVGTPAPTEPVPPQNTTTEPAPTEPAPPQSSSPDGQALYTSYCAECHGPNGKRGRSASAISSAIASNRGGMGSLSSLTSTEVQAIADYLAM